MILLLVKCSLQALTLLDVVVSGFQGHLCFHQNPSVAIGGPMEVRTTTNHARAAAPSDSKTVLFRQSFNVLEDDPLEDGRRAPLKYFNKTTQQKTGSSSSTPKAVDHKESTERRLVRPQKSISPPSAFDDEKSNAKASLGADERKATTSTIGGVNMELRDPKERVLVRHATASSAYGVDDFKGKRKKIIKPWSSGRKKNKDKRNNTGGIAREAYGEELKLELKNKPEKKRLVMARTNSSVGNQDAAKALMSGASKGNSVTVEDIAEEKRSRMHRDDDKEEDGFDFNDVEPNFIRSTSSIVKEPEDSTQDVPNLIRLSSSIVRQPECGENDEPTLVRLDSSIVKEPEEDGKGAPNLVRLDSSIVKEPKKDLEEELKFYTRSNISKGDGNKQEGQRLVRAVPASQLSSTNEPNLVRPIIIREQFEGPKLMRPNIIKQKVEEPKLIKPNVSRARVNEPKLVRANVQKKKSPEQNITRPKIIPDGMDVGKDLATKRPPLIRPNYSATKTENLRTEDFMYGAKASITSPTAVRLKVQPETFTKPAFTTGGCNSKFTLKNKLGVASKAEDLLSKEHTLDLNPAEKNMIENLMYGAKQAATCPTAVFIENSKVRRRHASPLSSGDNPINNLMYGSKQATESPTAIPLASKSNKKTMNMEEVLEGSSSDDSIQVGASKPSNNILKKMKILRSPPRPEKKHMDDLMYGYQCATSSPTAVKVKANPMKFVKSDNHATRSSVEESSTQPKGGIHEEVNHRRLGRSSTFQISAVSPQNSDKTEHGNDVVDSQQKRYIKPTTSVMNQVTDWDDANPTTTEINPTSVNLDQPVRYEARVVPHKKYGNINREKKETETGRDREKKYIQPSSSLMNNALDWDAVKPATTTSNPSIVNVDLPQLEKDVENKSKEKSEIVTDESKTKYVQPSSSLMHNVPNWDAVKPASTTSNPSIVNVDTTKIRNEVKFRSEEVTEKSKKKYVQPSTSLMDSAPDWDAVQPATTTSNPSVFNVVAPKLEEEVELKSLERKSKLGTDKLRKKRYVQPSISMMDNTPNWDAAQSTKLTYNPSHVSLNETGQQEENDDLATGTLQRKKYFHPSTSMMDSAPDWDAVLPAIANSNPSVVNIDGTEKIRNEKRLIEPYLSNIDEETHLDTRHAPNDVPFEDEQVKSIEKKNLAEEKSIGDRDVKTKPPVTIAHATNSTSDGWTPEAHFPSETINPDGDGVTAYASRKIETRVSSMESYDQGALPRPTGLIPLTVSSSAKNKTKLFRAEHSLEPVEDSVKSTNMTNDFFKKQSSSGLSNEEKLGHGNEKMASVPKPTRTKLFLYDGRCTQPKEPWDFTVEGVDTKLDKARRTETSTTEKKLVAYEKKARTGTTSDYNTASDGLLTEKVIRDEKKKGWKSESDNQSVKHVVNSRRPIRRKKLQEKTLSPFTRNVSSADDADSTPGIGRFVDQNKGRNSIDDESKDLL